MGLAMSQQERQSNSLPVCVELAAVDVDDGNLVEPNEGTRVVFVELAAWVGRIDAIVEEAPSPCD